jgi:hypothetical protein
MLFKDHVIQDLRLQLQNSEEFREAVIGKEKETTALL